MENKVKWASDSQAGFYSIPDQIVQRSTFSGYNFNVLCIGETGLGKTTLLNSLFNNQFEWKETSQHSETAVTVKSHVYQLEESSVKLKLMLVETVGYGDQINQKECYKPIVDYVDAQHEAYLQEELKIHRSLTNFHDTRVHVCLYLIAPSGHGVRALDLSTLKELHTKVNVIPIIAKSDTISKQDISQFKANVMADLNAHNIQVYQLPTDDEDTADVNQQMNGQFPFAVVASNELTVANGRTQRCRTYPWGTVFVENENHSDLVRLREVIIHNNMEDLRERTERQHYEHYRRQRLESLGVYDNNSDDEPQTFIESIQAKRQAQILQLQMEEKESNLEFVRRVKESEKQLAAEENKLKAMSEQFKRTEIQLSSDIFESRKKLSEDQNELIMRRQQLLTSPQLFSSTSLDTKKKKSFRRKLTLGS